MILNFINNFTHSTIVTIEGTYVISWEIDAHALPIIITNSREV